MLKKQLYTLFIILLLGIVNAQAQDHILTETFEQKIYFRNAYRYVDPSYRNNNIALNNLKNVIDSVQRTGMLVSVEIRAWASPSGSEKYNRVLAQNRTNQLALWIVKHCNIDEEKIEKTSGGVGWDLLCEMLSASNLEYKDKVIDIIKNTPIFVTDKNGKIVTGRKKQLMDLNYGRTWRDMEERVFADIRCGLAVIVNIKKQRPIYVSAVEAPITKSAEKVQPLESVVQKPVQKTSPAGNPFYMALKTNMLYDLVLVPNIGAEFYLGKGFTIGANWMYAWWNINSKDYCWRIYGGDIYARKYFGKRAKEKPLQGHHIGIYAQALTYDFELGSKGIMGGEPGGNIFNKLNYGAGIEYGYSLPIAKRLNMDFTLGLGYLGGEYREYEPQDSHYVWQATKYRHYWGPAKAEVSLVWLLGRDNMNAKKGGSR